MDSAFDPHSTFCIDVLRQAFIIRCDEGMGPAVDFLIEQGVRSEMAKLLLDPPDADPDGWTSSQVLV